LSGYLTQRYDFLRGLSQISGLKGLDFKLLIVKIQIQFLELRFIPEDVKKWLISVLFRENKYAQIIGI
jgi:hypothetical protein